MKVRIRDKVKYSFDKTMSKGTKSLLIMLVLIVAFVAVFLGIIAFCFQNEKTLMQLIWDSFAHMLDAGVIASARYDDYGFLVPMLFSTLFGVLFTAVLIGIINNAIIEKLESLKKGESKILDECHYVIIGYNERVFNIINQLIIAFCGSKHKHVIVVMGEEEKVFMESEIRKFLKANFYLNIEGDNKKERERSKRELKKALRSTTIICRNGDSGDKNILEQCNVTDARVIIINEFNDFCTMKNLLALNSIASESKKKLHMPYIVAVAMKKENAELFKCTTEGEWKKKILYFSDQISRITAHSCLHPGVSVAFDDLFDFGGNEIYIEKPKGYEKIFFESKKECRRRDIKFRDVLNRIKDASVIGYKRNDELNLNPDLDSKVFYSDKLIVIAEEPRRSYVADEPNINVKNYNLSFEKNNNRSENVLIFGCNENMAQILAEQNKYLEDASTALIACTLEQLKNGIKDLEVERYSEELDKIKEKIMLANLKDTRSYGFKKMIEKFFQKFILFQNEETIFENKNVKCHLNIEFRFMNIYDAEAFDINVKKIEEYFSVRGGLNHILVLSDTMLDMDDADEKTLFLLMNLRHKYDKVENKVNITTEMRKASNEVIASISSVDDFIISDSIVSNMVTQIARNEDLYDIFENILNVDGAEIYLEPLKNYIDFDIETKQEFNFYEIIKIVTSKDNKIPIGLRLKDTNGESKVLINPKKEGIVYLEEDDLVIVVANEK